jgi:Fe-Mn family superoxide dismutase
MTLSRRDVLKHTALLGAAATVAPGLLRGQSAASGVSLPELPYAVDALEPAIDARTMQIHHGRHHAGYVRKYNDAVEQWSGAGSLEEVLSDLPSAPDSLRETLRNNGGGVWNHTLFWESMAPPGEGGEPTGALASRLSSAFGSVSAFKAEFTRAASTRFGSGWAWLILRPGGQLAVTSTPNQDNPLMNGVVPDTERGTPLLGLDVWEHAYYLHYQNRRTDYISNWWKVVNWPRVAERLG